MSPLNVSLKSGKEEDKDIPLDKIDFDKDEKLFILSSGKKPDIKLYVDYVLEPENEYKELDFIIYLFKHDRIAENNIFQLYEKELKERIGWIFPIQSLQSKEHDYIENKYFLKYAFVAFKKLLINDSNYLLKQPECANEDYIKLEDFYGDNCVVVMLCKKQVGKIGGFNIDFYLPSLYKRGYYKITNKNFYQQSYSDQNKEYFEDMEERLTIERISYQLEHYYEYPILLFTELLKFQSHYLVKFHLLYQVMEQLIEQVFKISVLGIIDKILNTAISLYKAKEDIDNLFKERNRINKLFTEFVKNHDEEKKELMHKCNELLIHIKGEKEKKDNLAQSFYNVRNLLVHDYGKVIQKDAEKFINEINHALENLIVNILIDYNEPSES